MRNQEIDHSGGAFVGRLRELAELRAGIDGALAGRGRLMTIAGEPGVGKSRLADEAASLAADQGMRVLWGRCWEHGGAPAYWPWMQVLRDLTKGAEPILLSDWMGPGAAEIAQIVPELHDQMADLRELPSAALSQPEKARFRLFDAVVSFLRKAAEAKPLLILLDDLHAADSTSLLMLIALSRHVRASRTVVIGTYREVEIEQSPELAALIAEAEREGVKFPLRGLDEREIEEFVQRAWGVSDAGRLVNSLLDITDGNPFFLGEMLRQMAADGQLAGDLSKAPSQLSIPHGVSEFIKRLTQPLAAETYDLLSAASVIGREFDLGTLQAASQAPRDSLIERLDEAATLKLINEVRGAAGRYSFRHALIREALYDGLPAGRRRRLHCAVAEAIRSMSSPTGPFAEIAYHYCQGASHGVADLAVEFSRKAARTAERQLAYEDAARHLGNAIDVLGLQRGSDDLLYAELLCELGEAQFKTGDLAASRKTCLTAADVARRTDQPALFARAVVAAGRGVSNSGVTDRSLVLLLNEAHERLDEADSPLRAQALARLGMELYWSDPQQAVALCQQAVEMARRLGHPHTLIVALWGRHLAMRGPDSLEQRLADTREAIAIAERAGERDFALEARFYGIADLIEAGDVVGADVALSEYLAAEVELRDRYTRGLLLRGMRALMEGRLDESAALAQQAFVGGQQSGRPLTLNSYLIQHGMTLWERGRLGELEGPLRAFISQNPLIVFSRCGLQLCLLQLGRREEARIEFESLAEDEFRQVPHDWNWLPSMFVLADICADLGAADHAETLYRLLAPYASQNAMLGYVYSYGSVAFALGRLAGLRREFDTAAAHFEVALAANRRIRATVCLAHTQCEFGRLLLARGASQDRARAIELLASARQTAEALDLGRLKAKLEALAAETQARAASGAREADGADAPSPARVALEPKEADAVDAVVAAAIARARDLGAQASFEGTVTILFSDIEESTSLYERLGDLRAHEILRIHNEIVRQQIAAHRGTEVKALGDSFMVAFSSARRAALCAIAVQRSFAAYCERHPELPIRVRIGLHVGEAINESADYFGKAVILAARIAGLARGGQILTSSTLRDLAANAGDLRFTPMGDRELKGLAGAHRIFEIVW
jgi:class 3 adenylate cyclase